MGYARGHAQAYPSVPTADSIATASGRYYMRTDKVEQYDKLGGGFVTKEYQYDADGNVYEEKANTNNEIIFFLRHIAMQHFKWIVISGFNVFKFNA